jgi:hypothetical protein
MREHKTLLNCAEILSLRANACIRAKCPKCGMGAQLPDSKYCSNDGEPLEIKACPTCLNEDTKYDEIYCRTCGRLLYGVNMATFLWIVKEVVP